MGKYRVFVYGTLKNGYTNHHLLIGASFLGTGRTKEKYALYSSVIPYVVKEEKVSQIRGEIYQMDITTMNSLDQLEGHPDWYRRQETVVILDEQKSELTAWLYFYPHPTGILLSGGVF